jgi:hypothetical protein
MELNLKFYQIHSISYNFQKLKLNFEFELNKYEYNKINVTIHLGRIAAHGYMAPWARVQLPWPRPRPFDQPVPTGGGQRTRGMWPRLERPPWQARRRLNDGENPVIFEDKRSVDIRRHAATRKPRRRGQDGGAHRRGERHSGRRRHRRGNSAAVEKGAPKSTL